MEKERAKRFNKGKAPLDLLPLDMFTGLSRVLEMGEKKYGRNNWRKGAPATEQLACMLRHLQPISEVLNSDRDDLQFLLYDTESGLPHIDHILFNVLSLRLALQNEYNLPIDPKCPLTYLNKKLDTSGGGC
jgi:hypothetical protein